MQKSTADDTRAYIASLQKQIDDLTFTYGDSVRPAWVGEEIGILHMHQQDAKAQLRLQEGGADA
jgi:hypothetical protein